MLLKGAVKLLFRSETKLKGYSSSGSAEPLPEQLAKLGQDVNVLVVVLSTVFYISSCCFSCRLHVNVVK